METLTTEQKIEAAKVFKGSKKDWRKTSLGEAMLKDGGSPMVYDGDQLMKGMPVFVETDTATGFEPYPDGTYTLEDGSTVEIVEGYVANITAATSKTPEETGTQEQEKKLSPEQESAVKRIVETHSKETIYEAVKDAFVEGAKEREDAIKAEVEKQSEALKKDYEAKLANTEKSVSELTKVAGELIDLMKEKPLAKPAHQETTFTSQEEDNRLDEADARFKRVLELRKK